MSLDPDVGTAARRAAWLRGSAAERFVAEHLEALGWTVVDANWRGGGGELDLVMERGSELQFVEVRARSGDEVHPFETLDLGKRRRLIAAANAWIAGVAPRWEHQTFAVAAVDTGVVPWTLEVLDDAFDGD